MKNLEIIRKLKSVELCLTAHPDFETGSEFEDRVLDLQEIQQVLKIPVVIVPEGTVCDNCEEVRPFYLGTTCNKCNQPFRSVKQTAL